MSSSGKLVTGEGPGRIYLVEPTGPFVDDPNLTDKKYPENRTKSYRSSEPVRIVAEVTERQAHAPEVLQTTTDNAQRANERGAQIIDD